MGNSSLLQQQHPHSQLKEVALPQYGGNVLVDLQRNLVIKTFLVPAEEEGQFQRVISQRRRLQHPNLAKFYQLKEVPLEKELFCSEAMKTFEIEYELLTYSLFDDIKHHCVLKKPMLEVEICRIFEQVVSCLAYLEENNTQHGDIKVASIFFDSNRRVKLIDSFLMKQGKTSYEVVLDDPRSMSLLSPEQLDLLRIKLFDSLDRSSQNQMFMVGLTMLEVATIREGMKCYNLDSLTINQAFFAHAMKDIQDCGYSFELSNLIMNCVHKVPAKRPSFSQFLEEIKRLKKTNQLKSYARYSDENREWSEKNRQYAEFREKSEKQTDSLRNFFKFQNQGSNGRLDSLGSLSSFSNPRSAAR